MVFDFNLQSALLLPPFIQGVLYAMLIFFREKRSNSLSDHLLALLLILNSFKIAFWMLGYAGWYDTHDGLTTFMFYFPFNNEILFGPLIYFYFKSLTNTSFKLEKKHWPHLVIPAFWCALILGKFLIDYLFYTPFANTPDTQFGTKGPFAELNKADWVNFLSYAVFFYYLIRTLIEFRNYKEYMNTHFSSSEGINFNWLRNMLYAIIVGVIVMFGFYLLSIFNDGLTYYQHWYAYLLLGAATYYISIFGYSSVYSNKLKLEYVEKETQQEIDQTSLAKEDALKLKQSLLDIMENEKPFLQPDLTLSELSKMVNANLGIVSKVINEEFHQNFNEFINDYRLNEFVQQLELRIHKKQTLISIAYDCGFNSKATFNRAFKKRFSQAPIDYIRTHQLN